jgi:hypothetical protein
LGFLPPGEVWDALNGLSLHIPFYFEGHLPVPFYTISLESLVTNVSQRNISYCADLSLCPICQKQRFRVHRVGTDLHNSCFFCLKALGVDLGLAPTATITRTNYCPTLGGLRGRLVLCCPCTNLPYSTARNSAHNELSSFLNRNLAATPQPDPVKWNDCFAFVREFLGTLDWEGFHGWSSFDEWLTRTNISTQNKRAIQEQMATYHDMGSSLSAVIKRSLCKAFVKRDKDLPGFKARLIQGMEPIITAYTGPFISDVQHDLERQLCETVFFAAGKTSSDLSKWFSTIPAGYRILSLDMTNYDSTISSFAHDAAMMVLRRYARVHGHPDRALLKAILHHQKYIMKGRSRCFKYSVAATMKSGSSDTCLSNSIVNFVAITNALAASSGVPFSRVHRLSRMAIMGDDNLLAVPAGWNVHSLQYELEQLGFIPKIESSEVFLNMFPVRTRVGHVFSLLSGRLLARLFVTLSSVPRRRVPSFILALVECLGPSLSHDPICLPFLARIVDLVRGSRPLPSRLSGRVSKSLNLPYKILPNEVEPSAEIEEAYLQRYQLTRADLESWREFCSSLQLTTVLSHHVAVRAMGVDVKSLI